MAKDRMVNTKGLTGDALETELYKTADSSEFYRQVGNYMFWGATALMGALIGGALMTTGGLAAVAAPMGMSALGLTGLVGGASLATLAGSVHYSRKAALHMEQNDTLYSKRQADDMAEVLVEKMDEKSRAKAQEPAHYEHTQVRGDGKSWQEVTTTAYNKAPEQMWSEFVESVQEANAIDGPSK